MRTDEETSCEANAPPSAHLASEILADLWFLSILAVGAGVAIVAIGIVVAIFKPTGAGGAAVALGVVLLGQAVIGALGYLAGGTPYWSRSRWWQRNRRRLRVYGPIVVGVAFVVLSLFQQLRAISLSNG
jgi:hypothetical protein